jgi:DNA-binding NarL/FixJ family response regulator
MLEAVEGVGLVAAATNPAEALGAIRTSIPDVLVLDIQMPGGSGVEVLRAVRQAGLPTVVIILTNYATPWYRDTCLSDGADYFFDKSTEFDKVADVVERLARAARQPQ